MSSFQKARQLLPNKSSGIGRAVHWDCLDQSISPKKLPIPSTRQPATMEHVQPATNVGSVAVYLVELHGRSSAAQGTGLPLRLKAQDTNPIQRPMPSRALQSAELGEASEQLVWGVSFAPSELSNMF